MNLALSPYVEKLIAEHVKSGRFASPEDMIAAAVTSFDQQATFGDFAPGELAELVAEGDRDIENGDVLSGEEVFAALRRKSAERRKTTT